MKSTFVHLSLKHLTTNNYYFSYYRLKEEIMKSGMRPPNTVDPHWLEIQRRYAAAGLAGPPGGPPGLLPHHFALYPGGGSAAQLSQIERER